MADAESSDPKVAGRSFWWGFKLYLNSAAVSRLNTLSSTVAAAAAFLPLPPPVPALIGAAVAVRAVAYELVAGGGDLVIASPWPMPLMLAPVEAAKPPSDKMKWTVFSDGFWSSPAKFYGANFTVARPTLAQYANNLYLFHRGAGDERIWFMKYDPDLGWGESVQAGIGQSSHAIAAYEYETQLHVVHKGMGSDSLLYHQSYDGRRWVWSNSPMEYKYTSSGPALATYGAYLYCIARGTDNKLWGTRYDGSRWTTYATLGSGEMYTSSSPALAVYNNELFCVARGMENNLWWTRLPGASGEKWSTYTKINNGDVYSSAAPSLCVFRRHLFCVARGMDGHLWYTAYDGSKWSTYLRADFEIGGDGPTLISYKNQHSVESEELLCVFKDD
ncbi:bnr repeat-containing protein [Fusarium sp. NRRL 52700]|nr:bnr repeat-containing protein [Fusarium sp. NRRL 52700]